MEPPAPPPTTTTFTDQESLLHDFQSLLTDVEVCDTSILVSNQKALAIPSQILRSRSAYFRALLSPTWNTPLSPRLEKPNTSAPVFQDVLEYLVTGTITLSLSPTAIPHNLSLTALAHELLLPELETLLIDHITAHLTLQNLPLYITALHSAPPPPPLLEQTLVSFTAAHALSLPPLLSTSPWATTRSLWRMLVNGHGASPLPAKQLSLVVRALTRYTGPGGRHGRVMRVGELLDEETERDRDAMLELVADAPAMTFAHAVEGTGLFSEEEIVEKYRRDALRGEGRRGMGRPRVRVLCESCHPHESGVDLERSVRRVVVRGEGRRIWHALLRFDRRSSLAGGAELAFYIRDPRLGTHPHTFLVGRELPSELVLPAGEFWYAFASSDSVLIHNRWGWRFFVEPVAPEIDEID